MAQISKHRPASPRQAVACCGPLDDLLDPGLFKALCEPTRVLLIACLAKCGRACSVTEVAGCCSVDLSVVSRHLAILERAGVVEAAKKGRTVFYSVRFAEVCGMLRALADAIEDCAPGARSERLRAGRRAGCQGQCAVGR